MVNKEIVLQTVKRMYGSGIEDSVVEQTLEDIGLSKEEARKYINEAKGNKGGSQTQKPSKPGKEKLTPVSSPEKEAQEAMHTTTHAALESQAVQTTELLEKINKLEKSLNNASHGQDMPQSLISVNQRLASMEKQLRDLKAEIAATKTIMEKILETDRKVLNKL